MKTTEYKIVVSMDYRKDWECPLGKLNNMEEAVKRAVEIAELNGWGKAKYLDDCERKNYLSGWYVTNKFGQSSHQDSLHGAMQSLFRNGPDFIKVSKIKIASGKASNPNQPNN